MKKEIEDEFGLNCNYFLADLSSMKDTHEVANKLVQLEKPIDVLVHNAGVYLTKHELTPDGIEKFYGALSVFIYYKLIN